MSNAHSSSQKEGFGGLADQYNWRLGNYDLSDIGSPTKRECPATAYELSDSKKKKQKNKKMISTSNKEIYFIEVVIISKITTSNSTGHP